MKNVKKWILIFVLLFSLIFWFTGGVLQTFFQQDEWNGFGLVIQLAHGPIASWFNLLGPSHFIPLSQFFWFVLYRLFGFEAQYYALVALVLHAVASLLVYILAGKLTKNLWIGALTAVLFATNAHSAQAFTHLAIFPATITSFIVILVFFLYLIAIPTRGVFRRKDLFVLLILFFIAIFLREDGLILPILFPIYLLLFNRSLLSRKNLWFFSIFYGIIASFIAFRFILQLSNPFAIAVASQNFLKIFAYNAVSLPFKLVVQNLFEGIQLYNLFWLNKQYIYTTSHMYINFSVMYTVFYDFIILMVFNVMTVIYLLATKRIKDARFWNTVSFCIAWIVVSSGLLAVAGRPHNVVESRYLYLSSFPVLLAFSQLVINIFNRQFTWNWMRVGAKLIIAVVLIFIVLQSYTDIQTTIRRYKIQSSARRHILTDLISLYPSIPNNAIFFVRCKEACKRNADLVGIPNELVLPFTSGPGWIFMLQYARKNETVYAPFFSRYNDKEFLWDYGAEGFRRIGDYSFGYFVTRDLLVETLKKENLDSSVVIGLEYDENDFSLGDITQDVRKELAEIISPVRN